MDRDIVWETLFVDDDYSNASVGTQDSNPTGARFRPTLDLHKLYHILNLMERRIQSDVRSLESLVESYRYAQSEPSTNCNDNGRSSSNNRNSNSNKGTNRNIPTMIDTGAGTASPRPAASHQTASQQTILQSQATSPPPPPPPPNPPLSVPMHVVPVSAVADRDCRKSRTEHRDCSEERDPARCQSASSRKSTLEPELGVRSVGSSVTTDSCSVEPSYDDTHDDYCRRQRLRGKTVDGDDLLRQFNSLQTQWHDVCSIREIIRQSQEDDSIAVTSVFQDDDDNDDDGYGGDHLPGPEHALRHGQCEQGGANERTDHDDVGIYTSTETMESAESDASIDRTIRDLEQFAANLVDPGGYRIIETSSVGPHAVDQTRTRMPPYSIDKEASVTMIDADTAASMSPGIDTGAGLGPNLVDRALAKENETQSTGFGTTVADEDTVAFDFEGTDSEIAEAIQGIRREASRVNIAMALDQLNTLQSELQAAIKALNDRTVEVERLKATIEERDGKIAQVELERDLFRADVSKLKGDLQTCVSNMFDIVTKRNDDSSTFEEILSTRTAIANDLNSRAGSTSSTSKSYHVAKSDLSENIQSPISPRYGAATVAAIASCDDAISKGSADRGQSRYQLLDLSTLNCFSYDPSVPYSSIWKAVIDDTNEVTGLTTRQPLTTASAEVGIDNSNASAKVTPSKALLPTFEQAAGGVRHPPLHDVEMKGEADPHGIIEGCQQSQRTEGNMSVAGTKSVHARPKSLQQAGMEEVWAQHQVSVHSSCNSSDAAGASWKIFPRRLKSSRHQERYRPVYSHDIIPEDCRTHLSPLSPPRIERSTMNMVQPFNVINGLETNTSHRCRLFWKRGPNRSRRRKREIKRLQAKLDQMHEVMQSSVSTAENARSRLHVTTKHYEDTIQQMRWKLSKVKIEKQQREAELLHHIAHLEGSQRAGITDRVVCINNEEGDVRIIKDRHAFKEARRQMRQSVSVGTERLVI